MKIGVMSDTHGSLFYFKKALNTLSECDVILHGGDVLYHGPRNDLPEGYNPKGVVEKINEVNNILIARGNCDADVDQMVINHPIQSPYVMSQFGEVRIVITHGYTDSKEATIEKAKNMGADILVLGHTHVKELYCDENLVVLNPGSTSIPKDGTHSVAIIDIIQTEDELDMNFELIDINTGEIIHINED
ncbi:MAG: phosphodiesterase [Romboutsia sp.]|uniref:phosphodiesterase n=1 Tax=Romboutsia sp. TaxID=1965302 RepID=UPI003F3E39CB